MIRELKEEIARLRDGGATEGPAGGAGGGGGAANNAELERKMKEQEEAFAEMEREK